LSYRPYALTGNRTRVPAFLQDATGLDDWP